MDCKTIMLRAVDRDDHETCSVAVIVATRADIEACFRIVDELQAQSVVAVVFSSPDAYWYPVGSEADSDDANDGAWEEVLARFEASPDGERVAVDPAAFEGFAESRTDDSSVCFSRTHVWWTCIPKHEASTVETVPLTRAEALTLFSV